MLTNTHQKAYLYVEEIHFFFIRLFKRRVKLKKKKEIRKKKELNKTTPAHKFENNCFNIKKL